MSIKETLPDWRYQPAGPNYSYPLHSAIRELSWAMQYGQSGKDDLAFKAVQQALAMVRYYRECLPDQGKRQGDRATGTPDDSLLAQALCYLGNYVTGRIPPIPANIRTVEALLRTWLKRRLAEKEGQR